MFPRILYAFKGPTQMTVRFWLKISVVKDGEATITKLVQKVTVCAIQIDKINKP